MRSAQFVHVRYIVVPGISIELCWGKNFYKKEERNKNKNKSRFRYSLIKYLSSAFHACEGPSYLYHHEKNDSYAYSLNCMFLQKNKHLTCNTFNGVAILFSRQPELLHVTGVIIERWGGA